MVERGKRFDYSRNDLVDSGGAKIGLRHTSEFRELIRKALDGIDMFNNSLRGLNELFSQVSSRLILFQEIKLKWEPSALLVFYLLRRKLDWGKRVLNFYGRFAARLHARQPCAAPSKAQ